MTTEHDFSLADHGTIAILTPLTAAGREWREEHLPSDAMTWGQCGVVIEHRYVSDIVNGIVNDGLTIVGEA